MSSQNYTIVSVERTLQLLLLLAQEHRPLGVTEMSEALGFSKVAVFRTISTLMDYDFVVQNPDTTLYELGPSVLKLTQGFQLRNSLLTIAMPYLKELAMATKEVANIGVIQNGKVLMLKSVLGRPKSMFTLHLGPEASIHCSSIGKAIMSGLQKDEIVALLGKPPFPKNTRHTITTTEAFLEDLEKSRVSNIFFDNEEAEDGLMCIGTPVRDWSNEIVAAISVSGFKPRLERFGVEKIKALALDTAQRLSTRLVTAAKLEEETVPNLVETQDF